MREKLFMKWIAISGSWRKTNKEVEEGVRSFVRNVVGQGDGIVTGGALNVDYFATDEVLKLDFEAKHIKVFIPVTLELYSAHYRKRAKEGVITEKQAEMLIAQLEELKRRNPKALIENKKNTVVDKDTYYDRNSIIVENSNELAAFQVNNSEGVQDTMDKAKERGMKIYHRSYTIE